MIKAKIIALPLAAALLAACRTTTSPQGPIYSAAQVNRPMASDTCVITSVRAVAYQDGSTAQTSQLVGGAAGALIGRAIGKNVGGGSGQKLARDLGTIGGAVVGANAGAAHHARTSVHQAIEYGVRVPGRNNQSLVVVQPYAAGEPVMQAGSRCSLIGNGAGARVSPI